MERTLVVEGGGGVGDTERGGEGEQGGEREGKNGEKGGREGLNDRRGRRSCCCCCLNISEARLARMAFCMISLWAMLSR